MRSLLGGILQKAALSLRRAETWPEAEALVYSCTWTDDSGGDANIGLTTVTYSYRAADEIQSGEATWIDPKGVDMYHKGDSITVRFNPSRPVQSYFPEKQHLPSGVVVGFVFGLIVMSVLCLCTILLHAH